MRGLYDVIISPVVAQADLSDPVIGYWTAILSLVVTAYTVGLRPGDWEGRARLFAAESCQSRVGWLRVSLGACGRMFVFAPTSRFTDFGRTNYPDGLLSQIAGFSKRNMFRLKRIVNTTVKTERR